MLTALQTSKFDAAQNLMQARNLLLTAPVLGLSDYSKDCIDLSVKRIEEVLNELILNNRGAEL